MGNFLWWLERYLVRNFHSLTGVVRDFQNLGKKVAFTNIGELRQFRTWINQTRHMAPTGLIVS